MLTLAECRIGVIGLGYAGVPLAAEFGKRYPTIGFDVNGERVAALRCGRDTTQEMACAELTAAQHLQFSNETDALRAANVYIVTVQTRFGGRPLQVRNFGKANSALFGVKSLLPASASGGRL